MLRSRVPSDYFSNSVLHEILSSHSFWQYGAYTCNSPCRIRKLIICMQSFVKYDDADLQHLQITLESTGTKVTKVKV